METGKANPTLYWTIGGVALALLALFAFSKQSGGSASQSTTETPGVDSSALVSEVNNVNSNAAQVEETLLAAEAGYATTVSNNASQNFADENNTATSELATVENAATSRLANQEGYAAAESENRTNALAQVFDTANTNAAQENEVNTATSNEVNAVRAQANAQKDSSIFGSITSFLGGLFSGGIFGGGSSSAGTAGGYAQLPEEIPSVSLLPSLPTLPAEPINAPGQVNILSGNPLQENYA
jgi:hypothetical protein